MSKKQRESTLASLPSSSSVGKLSRQSSGGTRVAGGSADGSERRGSDDEAEAEAASGDDGSDDGTPAASGSGAMDEADDASGHTAAAWWRYVQDVRCGLRRWLGEDALGRRMWLLAGRSGAFQARPCRRPARGPAVRRVARSRERCRADRRGAAAGGARARQRRAAAPPSRLARRAGRWREPCGARVGRVPRVRYLQLCGVARGRRHQRGGATARLAAPHAATAAARRARHPGHARGRGGDGRQVARGGAAARGRRTRYRHPRRLRRPHSAAPARQPAAATHNLARRPAAAGGARAWAARRAVVAALLEARPRGRRRARHRRPSRADGRAAGPRAGPRCAARKCCDDAKAARSYRWRGGAPAGTRRPRARVGGARARVAHDCQGRRVAARRVARRGGALPERCVDARARLAPRLVPQLHRHAARAPHVPRARRSRHGGACGPASTSAAYPRRRPAAAARAARGGGGGGGRCKAQQARRQR